MDSRHRYRCWVLWTNELGSQWALAYPTLLEGRPGELHVAYSWAGRQAIRYLSLRETDILGEMLG